MLDALRRLYGRPKPAAVTDPFQLILYENIAYLADDTRREEAFGMLRERVGLSPEKILEAPRAALLEVARRGIAPAQTVEKLRTIASIALEEIGGELSSIVRREPKEAIKALRKYPSIGEPGAEKILLFSGSAPVLALDSNALRVLLRLGFGREEKSYAKSYRSAQAAAGAEIPQTCADPHRGLSAPTPPRPGAVQTRSSPMRSLPVATRVCLRPDDSPAGLGNPAENSTQRR